VKKVSVSPRARADLKVALGFYHDADPRVSRRFLQAVKDCIARIAAAPQRFPQRSHGARRLLVPKFPYGIYYSDGESSIEIIAIVHSRRHPDAWREGFEVND
jgi:plasmid stabilization system protein ParE